MRKVTFGGANSLDNYIARKDGAYDWILGSKEANAYLREYWKTIDTMVMGRKTYEVALNNGGMPNISRRPTPASAVVYSVTPTATASATPGRSGWACGPSTST